MTTEEIKIQLDQLDGHLRDLVTRFNGIRPSIIQGIEAKQSIPAVVTRVEDLESQSGRLYGIRIKMSASKPNPPNLNGNDFNNFEFSDPSQLTGFKTYARLVNRTNWVYPDGTTTTIGYPEDGKPLIHPNGVIISINGGQTVSNWLNDWVLAFNYMSSTLKAMKYDDESVIVYSDDPTLILDTPVFKTRSSGFVPIITAERIERSTDPEVHKVKSDVATIRAELTAFAPGYNELSTRVNNIANELAKVEPEIDNLGDTLDSNGKLTTRNATDITTINTALANIVTQVNALNTRQINLAAKITSLENENADIITEQTDLEKRIKALEDA